MANQYNFQYDKSVAALKLVLSNLKDNTCNFHKLFKIFYFADKKHIGLFGRPITGDRYIAMQAGPVPSTIYDMLKMLKGDAFFPIDIRGIEHDFVITNKHYIKLEKSEFDLELFSESELECLSESIEENKFLSWDALVKKSHDQAWHSAQGDAMSIFDIASAAGANEQMLLYITNNIENNKSGIN